MEPIDMKRKRKPYRYSYKDMATRIIATIPDSVQVFVAAPFENNSFNKYYLLSCRYLHPETNMVCVDTGEKYIPISSKEIYKMYLGVISDATYRKFTYEAMDINLLIVMQGKNGRDYFMINPVYASHKSLDFQSMTRFFTVTSKFSGNMEIDEKYIKDNIKPLSDKRLEM